MERDYTYDTAIESHVVITYDENGDEQERIAVGDLDAMGLTTQDEKEEYIQNLDLDELKSRQQRGRRS